MQLERHLILFSEEVSRNYALSSGKCACIIFDLKIRFLGIMHFHVFHKSTTKSNYAMKTATDWILLFAIHVYIEILSIHTEIFKAFF